MLAGSPGWGAMGDVVQQLNSTVILRRVTNMVDAVGTTKYAYAAGGRLTQNAEFGMQSAE
jgi:hypothetical protein